MVSRFGMNAILRHLFLASAIFGSVSMAAADPPVATSGTVLVIDFDRLVEGNIERTGGRYRVRQGAGEMMIPAGPNMVLVADREAAYQLVKSRFNPSEMMEQVRLARWCLSHQFNVHAIEHAEAAIAIQPDDRALRAFRDDLKLRASIAPPPSVNAVPPPPRATPPEPTAIDINPEALKVFVTKVQPILMNACVQCHGEDHGGNFHLSRAATNFADSRATQFNIAAASMFLNRDQPAMSPVLTRAVAIHGDCAQPPLQDRGSPAYRHLEEWVQLATGKQITRSGDAIADSKPLPNDPLKGANPNDSTTIGELPAGIVVPPHRPRSRSTTMPGRPNESRQAHPAETPETASPKLPPPTQPTGLPLTPVNVESASTPPDKTEPVDPFDPAQFNRMNQPKKP